MKNYKFLTISFVLIVLASCNNAQKKAEEKTGSQVFNLENAQCYQAISGADTATLKFDQTAKAVVGELAFNFKEKEDTKGSISGEFKGDTLFVDYSFKLKGIDYKNPQVFLKTGGKLTQGSGEMEIYLGRTYFKKGLPISFNGFVFEPVDCK